MADMLSALGVRYRPQIVAHQRLPLFERFEAELSALGAEASNAFFTEMGILAQGFGERYSVSDWRGAYKLIGRFCDRLLDRWPAVDFYYPWIVKGVCELHLEQFVNAEQTFTALISHPLCDENAHAGRGHACFGQRKLRRALTDYLTASAVARRAQRSDAEIEINSVNALIELGEPVPDAILSPNLDTVLDQDLAKVKLLRGVALAKLGRLHEARQQLAEVLAPPDLYPVAVSHLAERTRRARGRRRRHSRRYQLPGSDLGRLGALAAASSSSRGDLHGVRRLRRGTARLSRTPVRRGRMDAAVHDRVRAPAAGARPPRGS